jgi:hypothetical protein
MEKEGWSKRDAERGMEKEGRERGGWRRRI